MPRAKQRTPPACGTQFTREYKGRSYTLHVIAAPTGGVAYKVGNEVFGSPSTAARSITGGHVNGWLWWRIEQRQDGK